MVGSLAIHQSHFFGSTQLTHLDYGLLTPHWWLANGRHVCCMTSLSMVQTGHIAMHQRSQSSMKSFRSVLNSHLSQVNVYLTLYKIIILWNHLCSDQDINNDCGQWWMTCTMYSTMFNIWPCRSCTNVLPQHPIHSSYFKGGCHWLGVQAKPPVEAPSELWILNQLLLKQQQLPVPWPVGALGK